MEAESPSEARLRHQLDVQTKQINRVLSHHQIPATVVGGTVRPKVISFDLQTQVASGLERVRSLKSDLMSALGVGNVALTDENGRWQLRVTQPDDAPVPLLKLLSAIPALPRLTAALGVADGGKPVLLRFGANQTSHILIAGQRGAGKTSLLRAIAAGLALTNKQSELQLQVMDPLWSENESGIAKATCLMPLAYLPHMMTDPALDGESCAAVVHFLAEEMAYRRRERVQFPRIVVLLDHLLRFLESVEPEAKSDLLQLLQYGAQAGIHLVMATDRPDSPLLDSTIRASLSSRIVGRINDARVAERIAGAPLEQAPLLYGEGDFLAVAGEEATYFQAAYIGDYDLHMKLYEIARSSRPRLLARPYSSRPRVEKSRSRGRESRSFAMRGESVDFVEDNDDIVAGDND